MTRGALFLIALVLLVADFSNGVIHMPRPTSHVLSFRLKIDRSGRDAIIHDLLRQVLTGRLAEEDDVKESTRAPQRNTDAYDIVKKSLKARMDAEDSRKSRGNMKPVAHEVVKQALKAGLNGEHEKNNGNNPIHHAVRQAIVSGLIVEHNPRSGTYVIHDAVSKTVKRLDDDHNKNNAADSALVDQIVPKTGRGKIHNLLRHLLKARMEEEDISGKTDGVIHKRAQQVMKGYLEEEDRSTG